MTTYRLTNRYSTPPADLGTIEVHNDVVESYRGGSENIEWIVEMRPTLDEFSAQLPYTQIDKVDDSGGDDGLDSRSEM